MWRALCVLFLGLSLLALAAEDYRLQVTNWSCTIRPGSASVTGTVTNRSGRTMDNVRANLRIIGDAGTVLGTGSQAIAVKSLAPGALSVFTVSVNALRPGKVTRCDLWFRNPSVIQIATLVPPPK